MSKFTIGWLLWGLWFAIEEGLALVSRKTPNTLTGHIQHWFSVKEYESFWMLRRLFLLVFLGWLLAHLMGAKVFK